MPDDVPPVVPAAPATWLTLEAETLREMLARTTFAMTTAEIRMEVVLDRDAFAGAHDPVTSSASILSQPDVLEL